MSESGVERRALGGTGESVSVLGFGGVIVTNVPVKTASRYVAEAVDRGVNYFDVGPVYGNAQERLGPALKPYRDDCFLACKSRERGADGLQGELEESLRLLQCEHLDLYQLHGLTDVEKDVEPAFGPGGAMEAVDRAKQDGKIRFVGFSSHSEEAAHAAMDRYDFDSILFPFNYFTWTHGGFGHSVLERAREKGMGVLALKSLAHRRWEKDEWKGFFRAWHKCWYKPLDTEEQIRLALRFTLGLPADAAIPPGHWDLFEMCLRIVEAGGIVAPSEEELRPLAEIADQSMLLFEAAATT